MTCFVLSSYTFSVVSDPAVTNTPPDELYAQAKICFAGSFIVPTHELLDTCHIFILPSASEGKERKETLFNCLIVLALEH